jgi:glycosyltransferase involved in cell wall biosynthesis
MFDKLLRIVSRLIYTSVLPVLFLLASISRLKKTNNRRPSLVWGSVPIINNSYWSNSMSCYGYLSKTYVDSYFSINKREDWDRVLLEEFFLIPKCFKPFFAFVDSLFKFDIFFISYDGFFLNFTPIKFFQAQILKFAGKKIVVIPYGSDAYSYRYIRSTSWMHSLNISYPAASRKQPSVSRTVDYWNRHADAVIPGVMGFDGIGRCDVLAPSSLILDLKKWTTGSNKSSANRLDAPLVVAHSPNHRGCKGTEFIIKAVDQLKEEGLKIELRLLEGLKNDEVRNILCENAHILIEQLIFTGHGLSGLEGMASGLPTISNLEDEEYTLPMRRWSYLDECPLVSATPENIVDVLRKLVTNPQLRDELGKAGRKYVEKYHGYDSAHYLFSNVIDYIYGRKESIINLYHPILGDYQNRSPKIEHPLVNNRIIN